MLWKKITIGEPSQEGMGRLELRLSARGKTAWLVPRDNCRGLFIRISFDIGVGYPIEDKLIYSYNCKNVLFTEAVLLQNP